MVEDSSSRSINPSWKVEDWSESDRKCCVTLFWSKESKVRSTLLLSGCLILFLLIILWNSLLSSWPSLSLSIYIYELSVILPYSGREIMELWNAGLTFLMAFSALSLSRVVRAANSAGLTVPDLMKGTLNNVGKPQVAILFKSSLDFC